MTRQKGEIAVCSRCEAYVEWTGNCWQDRDGETACSPSVGRHGGDPRHIVNDLIARLERDARQKREEKRKHTDDVEAVAERALLTDRSKADCMILLLEAAALVARRYSVFEYEAREAIEKAEKLIEDRAFETFRCRSTLDCIAVMANYRAELDAPTALFRVMLQKQIELAERKETEAAMAFIGEGPQRRIDIDATLKKIGRTREEVMAGTWTPKSVEGRVRRAIFSKRQHAR